MAPADSFRIVPTKKRENLMHRLNSKSLNSLLLAFALFGSTLASLPNAVRADDITDENVAAKVASASTVADHLAIAGYYRKLAADNANKAALHERRRSQLSAEQPSTSWKAHCTGLIESYRAAQKAAEAMVAEQEKLASSLGK